MDNRVYDDIGENLIDVLPLIHKKFISVMKEGFEADFSHYHISILGMLSCGQSFTVSEIVKKMGISKSQMTAVLDKMVEMKMVTRSPDENDRRLVYMTITAKGLSFLGSARQQIKDNLKSKVSNLTDNETEMLRVALKNLRIVGDKIE